MLKVIRNIGIIIGILITLMFGLGVAFIIMLSALFGNFLALALILVFNIALILDIFLRCKEE